MSTTGQRDATATDTSHDELLTEIELLTEENQRLRNAYAQAKQSQYRRTALALTGVGTLAAISGLLVPAASEVLFILSGIGIFAGILTYYITPEQFVSADVGQAVYATLADNEAVLAEELGLTEERRYVPVGTDESRVRLFVPQRAEVELSEPAVLDRTVVVADDGATLGLAFDPSGRRLFESFETAVADTPAAEPAPLAEQLSAAIVEQFELARDVSPDADPADGRVTVAVNGSAYGPLTRFDHPIPSLLAVGLARGLDTSVTLEVAEAPDDNIEYLVTCRWNPPTED